jgi:hypothetical protein
MKKLFQDRWPNLHSDKIRIALRTVPSDIALTITEEQLDELVRNIAKTMDDVADIVRNDYERKKQ